MNNSSNKILFLKTLKENGVFLCKTADKLKHPIKYPTNIFLSVGLNSAVKFMNPEISLAKTGS